MIDENCPRADDLSAFLDDELPAGERMRLQRHLERCPVCARHLARLRELHEGFAALPRHTLGYDLGSVLEGRLASRAARGGRAARRRTWRDLFPAAIGAAASVALGLFMGLQLVAVPATRAAVSPTLTMMSVFDPVAPGHLCPGRPCGANGALR